VLVPMDALAPRRQTDAGHEATARQQTAIRRVEGLPVTVEGRTPVAGQDALRLPVPEQTARCVVPVCAAGRLPENEAHNVERAARQECAMERLVNDVVRRSQNVRASQAGSIPQAAEGLHLDHEQ